MAISHQNPIEFIPTPTSMRKIPRIKRGYDFVEHLDRNVNKQFIFNQHTNKSESFDKPVSEKIVKKLDF